MRAVDYIIKKRNGEKLQEQDIKELILGYVSGDIPDYQISAFLMAVFFLLFNYNTLQNFVFKLFGLGK